jgi:hypothetical protein
MVLGEPVLWAVIVSAIVAFEGKIDFCPARNAFHEVMLPGGREICSYSLLLMLAPTYLSAW